MPVEAELSEDERAIWSAGVEFYKPHAARDLLFDDGMVEIIEHRTPRPDGKRSVDEALHALVASFKE